MKYLLLLAGILGVFLPVFAQTYVIGVENIDYYPQYAWNNNEYQGYGRAILDAFADAKGYTFEYKAYPINRLFHNLVNDKIDFKYPDNPYWSADMKKGKKVTYSEEVTPYVDGVFAKAENKEKPFDEIKTLGLVQGFTPWDYLSYINSGKIKKTENDNFSKMILQALSNRIDIAYGNVTVIKYHLEKKMGKAGELVFMENYPHTKSSYFLSTTKHPNIIEEFNAFLKKNPELVKNLKKKFGLL